MSNQYLLPNGETQFYYANGAPLANGTVGMYIVNTLSTKTTYSDLDGLIPNINPVPLDGNGRARICGTGKYRQIVKDSNGATIWDEVISDGGVSQVLIDLASYLGSSLIGFLQSGLGAVVNTLQSWMRREVSVFDFMTAAEQADVLAYTYSGDYTAHIMSAYTAANISHRPLKIPAGGYRFTATLVLDKSVDILGANWEFTILQKDTSLGDFIGMTISGAAQQSRYENFRLTKVGAGATSKEGIKVSNSARMKMDRVQIDRQSGHGLNLIDTAILGAGVFSSFTNLVMNLNGGDGIHIDKFYASYFENLNLSQNTGWGWNLVQGNSHIGKAIICENNVAGGAQVDLAVANSLEIYGESNIGTDLSLTANSTRTEIFMYHSGGVSDLSDEGTNSMIRDIGTFPMFSVSQVSRIPRTTNVAGRDLAVNAGRAGPGATGHIGGNLYLAGGDAAGNTMCNGGNLYIDGGQDVVGGDMGSIYIGSAVPDAGGRLGSVAVTGSEIKLNTTASPLVLQNTGTAGISVGGSSAVGPSVSMDFQGTTKAPRLPTMTTASRDAMTAADGMLLTNTTTGKVQARIAGAWVDLN